MYTKLDYLHFFAFGLEVKVNEMLKYILLFSGEKYGQGWERNYQGKY